MKNPKEFSPENKNFPPELLAVVEEGPGAGLLLVDVAVDAGTSLQFQVLPGKFPVQCYINYI